MNIYVGNIAFSSTEEAIRQAFAEFGQVTSVNIIKDKLTGQSRGFAFVEMANANEARTAIESLNGKDLGGRKLTVNEARPREERPMGGGFGGGNRGGGAGGFGNKRRDSNGGTGGGRRSW